MAALLFAPAQNKFLQELRSDILMPGSTVEDLYQNSNATMQKLVYKYEFLPRDDSVKTEYIRLKDTWVRVYTPPSATGGEPRVVFIHGGWCIMGSVDIEDATCRRISKTSSMKVVSVGYRPPPKYKIHRWARRLFAGNDVDP
ncbi:hypothetical protein EMCG_08327 [[Emmonsia] crescens]|uniref:Alpha/beta hydrolase fold-3 domain-containing protein n=1 Tax=[Emmonsia] crescens TaxID=73230 RepID=A0A0G2I5N6_9EURO|nr:hypothetical protein EMCG_08327 [Emmonsia crescens UAMH 3008]